VRVGEAVQAPVTHELRDWTTVAWRPLCLRGRDYLTPHLPPTVGVRGVDATPAAPRRGVAKTEACGHALSRTLAVGDAPAQPEMY